ncbi:unnamed protein product [Psylliodes chrysocephalus]|uniref:C2H2-type domain-containing protein n=1 Tax=Psylliodes chrysocephalus TaxID=3402493 RepID=A0A9P0CU38_9CUCU|nr:unnamed protein product [Psylliodes chrysocephala]
MNCLKSYQYQRARNFYHKMELGGLLAYVCKICNKKYENAPSVINHVNYECNKEKQFKCNVCDRKFSRKGNLKVHKGAVHDVCGVIKQNTVGHYMCPRCGKVYKHKTSVYTHLKNDCGKPPQYFCDICEFSSRFDHVLRRHMMSASHKKRAFAHKNFESLDRE